MIYVNNHQLDLGVIVYICLTRELIGTIVSKLPRMKRSNCCILISIAIDISLF